MIGSIKGTIQYKAEGNLVVDVNGIGYMIFVPSALYASCQDGQEVAFLTYLHVREDALTLFGFEDRKQLQFFELLIGVSGIGPKMALAILSSHSVEDIQEAVTNAKAEFFQSVSGIGKKNSQRIIVDLQPKMGVLEELEFSDDTSKHDLMDALKSLGYSAKEVSKALKEVDSSLSEEEQIKRALRILAK